MLREQKDIIEQSIQFFCQHGFFEDPSLAKSDQITLREKMFSLMLILISDSTEVWPSYAVLQIESLEESNCKGLAKLDSKIKKIRKAGLKLMKKIRLKVLFLSSLLME